MKEKYYPKELEIVKEHISQFIYFDKYTSEKDLKELLEKNELLNIEKLEKILINTAKISDNTDFIKKLKIDGTMVLEKKHLHLFYYFLVNFFEKDIETEIKKFRKFFETNN